MKVLAFIWLVMHLDLLCSTKILQIGYFLRFAGTNFCAMGWLKVLLGTNFCDSLFKQQEAAHLIFNFYCTICQVKVHSKNVASKGVNFCSVLFCRFFIPRELIFVDLGQSAKSAKIRTRKIFMLHCNWDTP